jgi:hypothetical protein
MKGRATNPYLDPAAGVEHRNEPRVLEPLMSKDDWGVMLDRFFSQASEESDLRDASA